MSEQSEQAPQDPGEVNRRTRRKQLALLSALVGAAFLLSFVLTHVGGLSDSVRNTEKEQAEKVNIITAGGALEDSDLWRGHAETELLSLRRENEELKRALDDLTRQVERVVLDPPAWEEQFTRDMLIGLQEHENAGLPEQIDIPLQNDIGGYPEPRDFPPEPAQPVPSPSREIEVVGAALAAPVTPEPAADRDDPAEGKEKRPSYELRLPAGSFFSAILLGSLDAPTGQSGTSNPLPVLMRVEHPAQLPNAFSRDIRECFVTGAGYGDISSERAYIRTERLSCVTRGGDVIEAEMKGYVAGEDGKTGVRGTLVSRQGQALARSLFAGVMSGLGEAFHDNYSEIRALDSLGGGDGAVRAYPDGLNLRAGVARGAAGSLEKLSDYYLALADRMHPIIEVAAGRKVDVVLQEGMDIPSLRANPTHDARSPRPSGLEARYGRYADRK